MKNKLNIYSDKKIFNFIKNLLPNYEISLSENFILDDLRKGDGDTVIFYDSTKHKINKNNDQSFKNVILIHKHKLKENIKKTSNLQINAPITLQKFKSKIKELYRNKFTIFKSIKIEDKKITNLDNNKSCFLTEIEDDILSYLVVAKKGSKKFVKNNILNIKSNVESNSIDSHLTRIRKKLDKIETSLKIKSKNDYLSISID